MPWYSAGTVTVTNGSITVTGSGTEFSANVRVGDAFRGPDGGWYEVTNVASATVLSINPAYEGANAAGAAYRIAPLQGYVKESADRLRQVVDQWGQDLANLAPWSTSPDADTALDELGATDIGKALIRAIDAAAGRAVLELGTAATKTVVSSLTDLTQGRVPIVGWMWGSTGTIPTFSDLTQQKATGTFLSGTKPIGAPVAAPNGAYSIFMPRSNVIYLTEINTSIAARMYQGISNAFDTAPTQWREILHSGITAVDSNGFVKSASPITKLYFDHVENNVEAEDVTLQKLSTGVYLLLTERRFATEGWYIETPKDANGNIKVFVTYEENEDGILIKTFEPDYSTGPVTAGSPVDIPEGRWIDIRMTYTQAEIDAKVAAEQAADMEAVSEESESAPFGPDFQYGAKNVIESTENNPQEADPDE